MVKLSDFLTKTVRLWLTPLFAYKTLLESFLSSEYIQTLERFGQDPSLSLENQDLLLICSDGVWDLLKPVELLEIFTETTTSLQTTVEKALDEVLNRGAYDNATLIALRINFHK